MPFTPREQALLTSLNFDAQLANQIRALTPAPFEPLTAELPTSFAGLSIRIKDGDEAESLINALQPALRPAGFRAFWSVRRKPNGQRDGDELVILQSLDPYSIIHLRATEGGNYSLSTADILARLQSWESLCQFEVVGAAHDWVALVFHSLPQHLCKFAEEIYRFCPDSVTQGVGLAREADDPERFAAARQLCPDISIPNPTEADVLAKLSHLPPEMHEKFIALYQQVAATSTPLDMGIRLLAYELKNSKYLFLWWD